MQLPCRVLQNHQSAIFCDSILSHDQNTIALHVTYHKQLIPDELSTQRTINATLSRIYAHHITFVPRFAQQLFRAPHLFRYFYANNIKMIASALRTPLFVHTPAAMEQRSARSALHKYHAHVCAYYLIFCSDPLMQNREQQCFFRNIKNKAHLERF
ncbi:hypothetical protein VCUG_01511 [Vavraia culicis subsp. floridensis]|uniref:Uncharacterized protein n=1 Tax=Vavraia culicis (isolate floridensis) TaxID=948595 RepID=L2GV66_VAVCU|nr:uncharacterized protein VCUG_01511 [Vavraia culicis subsp. floridensis]ELA46980.1 hypothetical protein VCUG_01511 [Vavraia culicis subsp. floridensis]